MIKVTYSLTTICLFLCTGLLCATEAQPSSIDTSSIDKRYREQVASIVKIFQKEGYDINPMLKDKRFKLHKTIGDRFKNSAERTTPTLSQYKKMLGFQKKIDEGVQFYQNYKKPLNESNKKYDISPFIITAIIGIESDFGRNVGSYNPFNVYVSMMAVDYRADFAQAQLKELLEFTHRKKLDVLSLKSSYAGAMSYAQFIPYSVNKWWVGSDIFNMRNNIRSIGNYLQYFKKRTGSVSEAVLHYNTSELYQGFVLDLAHAIERKVLAK